MESIREISTVFGTELRRTLRSGRVIVLLALYSMFSLLVLLAVGSVSRSAVDTLRSQGPDAAQAAGPLRNAFLAFFFRDDATLLDALRDIPMVVLCVYAAALFFLPVYIAIIGFDQISGEVGPRSMRYLVVRAKRSSILLGKFAAGAAVLLALLGVVQVAVFVYAGATDPDFTTSLLLTTLFKFWVASAVYCLAYLALTTGCSALFRTPAMSLACNITALLVFALVNAIGKYAVVRVPGTAEDGPHEIEGSLSYLRYLTPSHYSADLLHPYFSKFAVSAGAYVAFAALFLGFAHLILRRRDL